MAGCCPNCGYCPHCGRGAQPLYPAAPSYPYHPVPHWTIPPQPGYPYHPGGMAPAQPWISPWVTTSGTGHITIGMSNSGIG